ncbi:hypothetical protein [Bradyrhizobium elkanii]|uniref:hypothetical protein n=1 Tax=Bradyrhizobium elkanii TaxID=29448 RepID=UPI0004B4BB5E|nr:hypothetical protein [Bradyrhizobium elkanii]
MSRLSEKVHDAVAAHIDGGVYDRHGAIQTVRAALEDDDRAILIDEALAIRVKNACVNSKKSAVAQAAVPAQIVMFPDLHGGYPIDGDGTRVKQTVALSRIELRRVIEIRRAQIKKDQAHLALLEQAETTVGPLWDIHPDMTFGEICELYATKLAAA